LAQQYGCTAYGLLLRLPHDVLVNSFVRLEARALVCLAATCRLLQHGQRSPHTPNPLEDALRLRAWLRGWSKTLPMDAREVINYLLRLAWQDEVESRSIFAGRSSPISFFVDAAGSLRSCGVEVLDNPNTADLLAYEHLAAYAGSMGFGRDWCVDSHPAYLRKEEPTLVPAVEGMRMRSVEMGVAHGLALADEGQVYTWGSALQTSGAPEIPTLLKEVSELRIGQASAGSWHATVLTDEGKLYTWWNDGTSRRGRPRSGDWIRAS
jgi:hypothetical protein